MIKEDSLVWILGNPVARTIQQSLNSEIGKSLKNGEFGDGYLLGDDGYSNTPFLLTPYSNPQNRAEVTICCASFISLNNCYFFVVIFTRRDSMWLTNAQEVLLKGLSVWRKNDFIVFMENCEWNPINVAGITIYKSLYYNFILINSVIFAMVSFWRALFCKI